MSATLELRGLARRYGDRVALDDVGFDVPAGRMVGFVGPNGAGKTTAMRIVVGVLEPDAGEVRWRGRPLALEERRRVGYMPEERGLYPKMRVLDQLVHLARLRGAGRADARAAADRWTRRLGVDERRRDRVEQLSLGNQQRVQLAAALVHEPEVLVLDEPFSGLDPIGVEALSEVLRERAAAGAAVLFSSHQLELVERLCDDVAIIVGGRLVAAGPVPELRRRGRRRAIRLVVEGGEEGAWAAGLSGVEAVARDDGGLLLALADEADDQLVLDAARSAGRVRHFAAAVPTLAEVFREAVSG